MRTFMHFRFICLFLLLASSCVKDEGKISEAHSSGGTTGTTSGGGTTGTSTGTPGTGNDPLAREAWHLENTGTQKGFSSSAGLSGEDIKVKYVHETLNILGRGIRVAVSDTGTELEHPDLYSNTLPDEHRNYTSNYAPDWHNTSPAPSDYEAHGTAVAGLIAALGWNNIGSRGVAPSANFAAFRFIFNRPQTETESSYLAKEIDQLYGDFDIFNFSYGWNSIYFVPDDETVMEAVKLGVTELRNRKGTLYVQSAGNGFHEAYRISVCNPGCSVVTFQVTGNANSHSDLATPYKIVVGATNAIGRKSSYSTPGSNLWVSAPGGEYGTSSPAMISTDLQGCNAGMSFRNIAYPNLFDFGNHAHNPVCDYTNRMNGTSAAAPVVSGVIALMLEANPNLKWRDVKHILALTSDQIDYDIIIPLAHPRGHDISGHVYDYKWVVNKANIPFSNFYGFGRVNATRAVEMARSYLPGTLGTFHQTKNSDETWYYDSGELIGKRIADQNPASLEDRIWVGHNYLIENIQIKLTTSHVFPGDLSIILVSPRGTESRLLNLNSKIYAETDDEGISLRDFIMSSNAFYGEESEGFWTIKITDGSNIFGSGDLLRWKILVNGRKRPNDLLKPLPPSFITLGATPTGTDKTPVFSFTNSETHSSVTRYEARVEKNSDGTVVKAWTSLGLTNYNHQFTGLSLDSDTLYDLRIRAVNSSGTSSIQLKQWKTN